MMALLIKVYTFGVYACLRITTVPASIHTRKDTSCVHRGADSVFVGADHSGSHLLHDRYERVGGAGV